jgi:hypothetical protein
LLAVLRTRIWLFGVSRAFVSRRHFPHLLETIKSTCPHLIRSAIPIATLSKPLLYSLRLPPLPVAHVEVARRRCSSVRSCIACPLASLCGHLQTPHVFQPTIQRRFAALSSFGASFSKRNASPLSHPRDIPQPSPPPAPDHFLPQHSVLTSSAIGSERTEVPMAAVDLAPGSTVGAAQVTCHRILQADAAQPVQSRDVLLGANHLEFCCVSAVPYGADPLSDVGRVFSIVVFRSRTVPIFFAVCPRTFAAHPPYSPTSSRRLSQQPSPSLTPSLLVAPALSSSFVNRRVIFSRLSPPHDCVSASNIAYQHLSRYARIQRIEFQ